MLQPLILWCLACCHQDPNVAGGQQDRSLPEVPATDRFTVHSVIPIDECAGVWVGSGGDGLGEVWTVSTDSRIARIRFDASLGYKTTAFRCGNALEAYPVLGSPKVCTNPYTLVLVSAEAGKESATALVAEVPSAGDVLGEWHAGPRVSGLLEHEEPFPVVGDFNRDGVVDLITSRARWEVCFFYSNGGFAWEESSVPFKSRIRSLVLNRAGPESLAELFVLQMTSTSVFHEVVGLGFDDPERFAVGSSSSILILDADEDGWVDLFESAQSSLSMSPGKAPGGFALYSWLFSERMGVTRILGAGRRGADHAVEILCILDVPLEPRRGEYEIKVAGKPPVLAAFKLEDGRLVVDWSQELPDIWPLYFEDLDGDGEEEIAGLLSSRDGMLILKRK